MNDEDDYYRAHSEIVASQELYFEKKEGKSLVNLNWQGRDLFVGKLWAGQIARFVPEGWRNWSSANADWYEKMEPTPWRAWVSCDEEGDSIGFYATSDEAKAALVNKVLDMIGRPKL